MALSGCHCADRLVAQGLGRVYTSLVDPARLLARITAQRADEHEYVVDTRGRGFVLAETTLP